MCEKIEYKNAEIIQTLRSTVLCPEIFDIRKLGMFMSLELLFYTHLYVFLDFHILVLRR